ncbi:MAG: hypothetical protein HYZ27_04460 [Deltaproteobacteria bacterium]|nr:hypothetical protein [Deltaproteobacteria bacterium]
MVGEGIARTTNAVMGAGEIAAPFIPGGAVLSAAISGVGQLKSAAGATTAAGSTAYGANATGLSMQSGVSVSGGGAGAGFGTTPGAGAPGAGGDMFTNMRSFQAEQMSLNMQYLVLQQQMQQENRQFTTLSNVMKTKHDTAKNAINNVR